jgi:hypothetical protein
MPGAGLPATVQWGVVESSTRHRALTNVVVLLAAGAVATACSGGDDTQARAAESTAPASQSAAASPAPSASASASRRSQSRSARPSGTAAKRSTPPPARTARPGTPAVDTAAPSVAIRTLPPADIGAAVQITRNVVVTVSNIRTTTVSGTGPGEVAGEGVVFSVGVRNQTTASVDVGGFSVTASYGQKIPAIPSDSAPSAPLTGTLRPGAVATGTYVFRMPADQVGSLNIQVSSDSSPNIVVFVR